MAWQEHEYYLKKCIELSKKALESGNLPFGAILVDSYGRIILEGANNERTESDYTGHGEMVLIRKAAKLYSKDYLGCCTLYSNCEPCVMCAGAIYYSNVGRVVFAITDEMYREMTGDKSYPLMKMTSRDLFANGGKKIETIGPFEQLTGEVIAAMKL